MVEPVKYPKYTGIKGNTQGEMNESRPARKAAKRVTFSIAMDNLLSSFDSLYCTHSI
jgi:hypothetical protein